MRVRREGFGHEAARVHYPARRLGSGIGLAPWGAGDALYGSSYVIPGSDPSYFVSLSRGQGPHIWRDPDDLALVFIFPTIFIAVFFGSSVAVVSSFAGALAAAYFIYPPYDSILIDDPRHIAELGFFLLLAITGSKVVAVLREGPLKPPLRVGNLGGPTPEREFRAILARPMDLPAAPMAG